MSGGTKYTCGQRGKSQVCRINSHQGLYRRSCGMNDRICGGVRYRWTLYASGRGVRCRWTLCASGRGVRYRWTLCRWILLACDLG